MNQRQVGSEGMYASETEWFSRHVCIRDRVVLRRLCIRDRVVLKARMH
jgi:hypothetical protein